MVSTWGVIVDVDYCDCRLVKLVDVQDLNVSVFDEVCSKCDGEIGAWSIVDHCSGSGGGVVHGGDW